MNSGIGPLDVSLNKSKVWLGEIKEELHLENEEQAWKSWKAVSHALRDRLPVEEAAHLAAQLPTILRGAYYEQYHPAGKPLKIRELQEFYAEVRKGLEPDTDPKLTDPERITLGVLTVMDKHVTQGELEDIRGMLPADLQRVFPAMEEE